MKHSRKIIRYRRIVTSTYQKADVAPLEYRYALDAAMPVVARRNSLMVLCNVPQLESEVRQRLSHVSEPQLATAGLWIEPLRESWMNDLKKFQHTLDRSSPLIILASRPLANLLPERRSWTAKPLGTHLIGLSNLSQALLESGFALESKYGVHSILAIVHSLVSRTADLCGRPDLGDRLQFAARLHYCIRGPLAGLSTLALIFARRVSS